MRTREQRFEALVQGHSALLYRYAYWLCGADTATAEDIVQETFLRAWRSLEQLEDVKAVKSWLITILRRENARRFERKQFDYVDVELENLPLEDPAFERDLERAELQRGMLQLEPMYRDPLLLQTLGGFSCQEIADILDLGRGAVMTRLFRAKRMLMDILDPATEVSGHG